MSTALNQYLIDAYVGHVDRLSFRDKHDLSIQIDDQDDGDPIDSFCNIFVTVGKREQFEVELVGRFPVTQPISDLAEIYNGVADPNESRVVLRLNPGTIEALADLSLGLRATAFLGDKIGNAQWERISARTISSLRRFIRVVREYQRIRKAGGGR
jgi:hypothetical protein